MAATRNTRTRTATREEIAESVPTTTAAAVASELAPVIRGVAAKFDACRIAYAGVQAGIKPQDIADETTRLVAEAMADEVSAKNRAEYIRTVSSVPQKNGGASITRVAIVQRKDAWADLVQAGITPTSGTIEASLRVTSTGGTAELRKGLIAATKKVPTANRAKYYIERAAAGLTKLADAKKAEKSENAAGQSADNKAEQPTESVTVETIESFVEYVRAFVAAPHSDEEKATLNALFTEALATL